MAWSSSGSSNAELIDNMLRNGILAASARVARAMKKVDRANYVRDRRDAYQDSPQSIGHGATISAPHMHAYAAAHLLPYLPPGGRVLDIGSGSGYLSAVFYHLINDPHGENPSNSDTDTDTDTDSEQKPLVTGIEHVSQLTDWSLSNLNRDGLGAALENGQIQMITGDGRLGYPKNAPYNAIHVGAAAPDLPQALVDQLAPGGRIFIPIGTYVQNVYHIDKDETGKVTQTEVMGVRYVPLTDRESQEV
ncbi:Pcmt1-prov protein [Lentinula raphanica]|nr:Pcmt1-prov protein [Lentinula raphanica]